MIPERATREDRRRELALWVLYAAEFNGLAPLASLAAVDEAIVGTAEPLTAKQASPYHRIDRFDDFIPERVEWEAMRDEVTETVHLVAHQMALVDEHIQTASPRWRLDRMPPIDRTLLRIGVAELISSDRPRARGTVNGLMEIAKRYGEEQTPRFVNGILDQVRRNLNIPFN